MASVRKVRTRSMSKDSSSSSALPNNNINSNNNINLNKNINPKKSTKTDSGLPPSNNNKDKKQQEMKVEFTPTENVGVEVITFGFSQETSKTVTGIHTGSEEDKPMDFSFAKPLNNKRKQ